jgi:mono/diheme cytochrome c family protein
MKSVVLSAAVIACVFVAPSSSVVDARQARRAADGVYADAQAKRGDALYQSRCASCHGENLTGDLAPALVGQGFQDVWNQQPLSDLFDKILNTMPAETPGTLSRPQVADLVSSLLQANKFPAGRAELDSSDAALKLISLAVTVAPAAAAAQPALTFPATGNLNQVMRGILFPSSNVLFDVQTQDPSAQPGSSARAEATTTSSRYGNVYAPWMVVDAAAIAIAEAGPLLMTPGRRCENGKAVPVDRADWQQYVRGMLEAGRAAYRVSQSRNQAAVSEVTNQISDACGNCHRVYRDTPTAAMRCTAP